MRKRRTSFVGKDLSVFVSSRDLSCMDPIVHGILSACPCSACRAASRGDQPHKKLPLQNTTTNSHPTKHVHTPQHNQPADLNTITTNYGLKRI